MNILSRMNLTILDKIAIAILLYCSYFSDMQEGAIIDDLNQYLEEIMKDNNTNMGINLCIYYELINYSRALEK